MIIRLRHRSSADAVQALISWLEGQGLHVTRSPDSPVVLAVAGGVGPDLAVALGARPEVEETIPVAGGTVLVHRGFRTGRTVVRVGEVRVGGGEVVVIAGPCSVEGLEAVTKAAKLARRAGAHILRGGAFKPRTSPYSFQGLGVEGLRQLKEAGEGVGMPVVSEIMDKSQLGPFTDHGIDLLQIGARNMQNFTLLKAVAGAGTPVLLKRGLAATADEWLQSAEYLAAFGCRQVILCERGIRTFEPATRNTLDLTVLPLLRERTHLPVIVDPSHAAGIASLVAPLSRAAVAVGSDGIAVEFHPRPSEARSDGPQALLPGELSAVVAEARVLAAVTGKALHPPPARCMVSG